MNVENDVVLAVDPESPRDIFLEESVVVRISFSDWSKMERVFVIDNEFDPVMVSGDAVEGRLLDVVSTAVDEINCTGDKGVVMFSSIKVIMGNVDIKGLED